MPESKDQSDNATGKSQETKGETLPANFFRPPDARDIGPVGLATGIVVRTLFGLD